ncbi:hypothetical protein N7582_000422 [Saccharomyces uvarum]|uniref:CID domain-containing protein n=1 Tax=Saccharomyces uvarum TaxID=230603 RepID=A0AA35JDS9_SACUV|nr:hypothetical protein N7582_000422 [Saccharomyces uvarum]CAI4055764.1 hypothetical protein SUVC_02G3490 [Saccharomyces uvarum]
MDHDTEVIIKDFNSILEELTFNSRPIITTLTKLAEENISCAQYFVDCIENRIEKCMPKQKLYAFYALDSICKNVGSPYTIYFSRNLFNLYRKTYLLVDNTTRTKLINMFKLWLNPNDTGMPLFEGSALEKIEQFLIKASALHQKNLQAMLPTPTVPLLLRDIDKLTALTSDRLKNQPNDEKLKMKLLVLSQLKQELKREKLTLNALKQVQMQLRQVFSQDQQVLQERMRYHEFQQQQQQQQQQYHESKENQGTSAQNPNAAIPLFGNNPDIMDQQGTLSSSLFGNISGVESFQDIEKKKNLSKIKNLYESLQSEGLIYTPPKESIVTLYTKLNGHASYSLDSKEKQLMKNLPKIPLLNDILSDCKAYFATVNVDVLNNPTLQLSEQTLLQDNPIVQNSLIHLLYRSKPNKCSVCGKRFGNSESEKQLQNEHLDWHFRINTRIKGSQNTANTGISNSNSNTTTTRKNIQSRNWYLSDSQWVAFKDEEITSTKHKVDYTDPNAMENSNNIDNPSNYAGDINEKPVKDSLGNRKDNEAKIREKYVVVPETSQDMVFKCPICKETVTGVYDEESGEWIWKNTIEVNDKYFHSTCYHETSKSLNKFDEGSIDLDDLKKLITK